MKRVISPLREGNQGADVVHLQDALLFLIDKGIIPAKRVLGRVESRRSWIDAVYAEPDQPNSEGQK